MHIEEGAYLSYEVRFPHEELEMAKQGLRAQRVAADDLAAAHEVWRGPDNKALWPDATSWGGPDAAPSPVGALADSEADDAIAHYLQQLEGMRRQLGLHEQLLHEQFGTVQQRYQIEGQQLQWTFKHVPSDIGASEVRPRTAHMCATPLPFLPPLRAPCAVGGGGRGALAA